MKSLLAALALLTTLTLPATAGTYGAVPGADVVRAEVLPGWTTAEGTRMVALRLTLKPGWKTYWRAPGEAGIPPRFDWGGSKNLASVTYHWPRPEVFESSGMQTIGYKRELVLPIEVRPERPGKAMILNAEVELGVCEEICVPAALSFSQALTGQGGRDAVISAALAARPQTAREAGIGRVTCEIEPITDGIRITARIPAPPLGGNEVAVIEPGDPRIWTSEAETHREGGTLVTTVDMVPPSGKPMALSRENLRFTLLGRRTAVDIRGCHAPG
ncbi:protein-disulfide reductase DsbD domain-containing protein [Vannielia sp.]|uniref:protein-disulfide reductase DsbD domain-containing protein n=1 Tax=Vannielia sp. TaxID=2813045 RepID=UPI002636A5AD|nr:protein-disulfide reductase DsbD domain-containing protein [Vannielia sp.]MDF1871070.1 protein-disulfide reductase DsbD family protein [Vannielia sp.]